MTPLRINNFRTKEYRETIRVGDDIVCISSNGHTRGEVMGIADNTIHVRWDGRKEIGTLYIDYPAYALVVKFNDLTKEERVELVTARICQ